MREHTILVINAQLSAAKVIAHRHILKRVESEETCLISSNSAYYQMTEDLRSLKDHEADIETEAISAWSLDLESPTPEKAKEFDQSPGIERISDIVKNRHLVGVVYASRVRTIDDGAVETIEKILAPVLGAIKSSFWSQEIPVALVLHPSLRGLRLRLGEQCENMNIKTFCVAPDAGAKEQGLFADTVLEFISA